MFQQFIKNKTQKQPKNKTHNTLVHKIIHRPSKQTNKQTIMRNVCILLHHRLPALCCAILCTGALALSIGTASTCQFFKVQYDYGGSATESRSGYSEHNHETLDYFPIMEHSQIVVPSSEWHYMESIQNNNNNNENIDKSLLRSSKRKYPYNNNPPHDDIGLFCSISSSYNYNYASILSNDILYQIARGFQIISLFILILVFVSSWYCTILKPSYQNWKTLSILSVSCAAVEIPVFLFYACSVCQGGGGGDGSGMDGDDLNNDGGEEAQLQLPQRQCLVGQGFFMLLWSIGLLCSVTVVTQLFNYPEYMQVLDEWRVKDRTGTRTRTYGRDGNNEYDDDDDYDYDDEQRNFIKMLDDGREDEEGQRRQRKRGNSDHHEDGFLEEGRGMRLDDYHHHHHGNDGNNTQHNLLLQKSPGQNFTENVKQFFFGTYYDTVKHEIFREDSDYHSSSKYPLTENNEKEKNGFDSGEPTTKRSDNNNNDGENNNNSNNNKTSTFTERRTNENGETQQLHNSRGMFDMRMMETKSDSSRLLIHVGPNGKKLNDDDDRQSTYSFDLNLDDYDISHELEDVNDVGDNFVDDEDDLYKRKTLNLATAPTKSSERGICQATKFDQYGMMEVENKNDAIHPVQFSPSNRAAIGDSSMGNRRLDEKTHPRKQDDEDIVFLTHDKSPKRRNEVIFYPTQQLRKKSPKRSQAVTSYPTQQLQRKSPTESEGSKYPTQQLQRKIPEYTQESRTTYPTQQLQGELSEIRKEDGELTESQSNQNMSGNEHRSIDDRRKVVSLLEEGEVNISNEDEETTGHQQIIITDKDNEAIKLSEYFKKAILAGTHEAENSNNSQEEEPEPVYYSSSDSETSSISTCSQASEESTTLFLDDKQNGSYSDGDLPQTSQYLKKRLRRLQRKAERRKSRKKPLRSSKSVCSRISLMEMTIDEETDLDLELEDRSEDDDDDDTYLASTCKQDNLKNSLPAIVTPYQKKTLNMLSPASITRDIYDGDESNQNGTCNEKIRQCIIPREIPIVSPTSDNGDLSETESVSKSARIARRKRIKSHQSKKFRSAKKKLSTILRANHSVDNSYGSDEASC